MRKEADAAVKASFVVSEMIGQGGKAIYWRPVSRRLHAKSCKHQPCWHHAGAERSQSKVAGPRTACYCSFWCYHCLTANWCYGKPSCLRRNVEAIDFKTHSATFQMFEDLFCFDVQNAPSVLQMELIELQCNSELKAKFREANGKSDKLGKFERISPILPRAFWDVQVDHVRFWKHISLWETVL